MAALKLRAHVRRREESFDVEIPICEATLQRIAEEIISPLNRYGAQCAFSVHDPTPAQLVRQYTDTGGMQRCVNSFGVPNASVVS